MTWTRGERRFDLEEFAAYHDRRPEPEHLVEAARQVSGIGKIGGMADVAMVR